MKNQLKDYAIGSMIFDDWKIVEDLGSGSYGTVYKIEKAEYGIVTHAALKVIRVPKNQSEIRDVFSDGMDEKSVTSYFQDMVNSLVREIAVMSTLKSHPNIVAYENHKVESHPGTIGWDILIQMELLTSLRDYQKEHPMTEADVHRLAVDMCNALVFCQKKALIHRDIKPQNIFVSEAGQFKLGDFGVARTMDKTVGSLSKQGTEDYMAPEVYWGQKYGSNMDIYSLGLVLYRLMNNNRLPFMPPAPDPIGFGDRQNALTDRIAGKKEITPPCNASPEFARIILKACAHDPKDRYQTAAEMLEALNECIQQTKREEQLPREVPENGGTGDDGGGGTIGPFSKLRNDPPEDEDGPGTLGPFRNRKDPGPPQEPQPPEPAPKKPLGKVITFAVAGVALAAVIIGAVIIGAVTANGGQKPSDSPALQTPQTSQPATISTEQETTQASTSSSTEPELTVKKETYENGNVKEEYFDSEGNLVKSILYEPNGDISYIHEYAAGPDGKYQMTHNTHRAISYPGGTFSGWIVYDYDSSGRESVRTQYDPDGEQELRVEYQYQSNGQVEAYTYESDGLLRTFAVYSPNPDGSIVISPGLYICLERVDYNRLADGTICSSSEWTYDEDGNLIAVYHYNDDGTLWFWSEHTYNEDGNEIAEYTYNDDGTLDYWYEYTYDEYGKRIAQYNYNNDGTLDCWYEYTYDEYGNETACYYYNDDGTLDWWIERTYDEDGLVMDQKTHYGDE